MEKFVKNINEIAIIPPINISRLLFPIPETGVKISSEENISSFLTERFKKEEYEFIFFLKLIKLITLVWRTDNCDETELNNKGD